jgi:hypothetical protein
MVRATPFGNWKLGVANCVLTLLALVSAAPSAQSRAARPIAWADVAPVRARLEQQGLTAASFPAFAERLRSAHAQRVREGDLDHLIFYLLQSTRFTSHAPIEPALSARALAERLTAAERDAFLRDGTAPAARVEPAVGDRIRALLRALDRPSTDQRLAYFRSLVDATFPDHDARAEGLLREYLRVMRFVYRKEFIAQRSADAPAAVAELYRSRGLSTDTAVEAGYLVHLGLGVVKGLDPDRRIRRVLIVGPGLDLAPRTAFIEAGPPESYQPWAVIDALLSLGLAAASDLEVVAADINPRVVDHLSHARSAPPTLRLVSEIGDTDTIALSPEFREYFAALGNAAGDVQRGSASGGAAVRTADAGGKHLRKTVRVTAQSARTLTPLRLDIVTERLEPAAFDLVIATNILPYFDDMELALAISNIAAMLAPGGVFLHNEARPLMQELTAAVGLPFEQARHAVIATVRGAPAPLFDSVFLHRRR